MIDLVIAKRDCGQVSEEIACRYLQKQGLQLCQRNYQCRLGEVDLIMREKDILVFVEVRYRRNNLFGSGAASVVMSKRIKLIKTAQYYLKQCGLHEKATCRFDVVALSGNLSKPTIEWLPGAFTTDF